MLFTIWVLWELNKYTSPQIKSFNPANKLLPTTAQPGVNRTSALAQPPHPNLSMTTFYAGLRMRESYVLAASVVVKTDIVETPRTTVVVDASLLTGSARQARSLLPLETTSAVPETREQLVQTTSAALLRVIVVQLQITAPILGIVCSDTGDAILTPRLLGLLLRMLPDL